MTSNTVDNKDTTASNADLRSRAEWLAKQADIAAATSRAEWFSPTPANPLDSAKPTKAAKPVTFGTILWAVFFGNILSAIALAIGYAIVQSGSR